MPTYNQFSDSGVQNGQVVYANHVTQFVDGFTAAEGYDIYVSGSFKVVDSTAIFSPGYQPSGGIMISDTYGYDGEPPLILYTTNDMSIAHILADREELRIRNGNMETGNGKVVIQVDQTGSSVNDIFDIAVFGSGSLGTYLYHTGSLAFYTDSGSNGIGIVTPGFISGSTAYLSGLSNTTTPNIVGFDISTGALTYYSTGSFGGGGGGGTSGTSGTGSPGTSGTSGITGTSGTSGETGTSGTSGTSIPGDPGSSGTSGAAGTSGTSSPGITSGTSGLGSPGTSGTSGVTVNTGSLMVTGSVLDDTITFTKGDATTFDITVNNVVNATSASYAVTSSYAPTTLQQVTDNGNSTIDYISAVGYNGGYLIASSGDLTLGTLNGDVSITAGGGNGIYITGSINSLNSITAPSFTGSLFGTASWAENVLSASYATTASYVLNAVSASYATTASYTEIANTASYAVFSVLAGNAATADLATTASYVLNAVSASYAPNLYNSDGDIFENRTVTLGNDSTVLTFDLSTVNGARVSIDTVTGATFKVTGSGGVQLDTTQVSAAHLPNTVTPSVLGYNTANGIISYYNTSSIIGNAFVQGGNSFGTTATIGTNDSNELVFETNNQRRASIASDGTVTIGNGEGALNTILNNNISTSNTTPTTLLTLSTTSNTAYTVHAFVTGILDAAAGTEAIGGEVIGVFNNDGTLFSVGSPINNTISDLTGASFTLTTSGTNIILQVTGTVDTVYWSGNLRYTSAANA